jgi:hypothetical protein
MMFHGHELAINPRPANGAFIIIQSVHSIINMASMIIQLNP